MLPSPPRDRLHASFQRQTYPCGNETAYAYDKAGRPVQVTDAKEGVKTLVHTYGFDISMINFTDGKIQAGAKYITMASEYSALNDLAREGLLEKLTSGRGTTYYYLETIAYDMRLGVSSHKRRYENRSGHNYKVDKSMINLAEGTINLNANSIFVRKKRRTYSG
jgi:YD repeat-containing protein